MWNKIKTWVTVAGGAVVAFLLFLLRVKNRKISKQEEKIEELKTDVKASEMQTVAKVEEAKQSAEISEIRQEESERIEQAVKADNPTEFYNNLVEEWNNEKD